MVRFVFLLIFTCISCNTKDNNTLLPSELAIDKISSERLISQNSLDCVFFKLFDEQCLESNHNTPFELIRLTVKQKQYDTKFYKIERLKGENAVLFSKKVIPPGHDQLYSAYVLQRPILYKCSKVIKWGNYLNEVTEMLDDCKNSDRIKDIFLLDLFIIEVVKKNSYTKFEFYNDTNKKGLEVVKYIVDLFDTINFEQGQK